jgi:hypothetical protein
MNQVVPIVQKEVHQTKWGFVAYSYENYRKLKRLNFIFKKAQIVSKRWDRWCRKAPHNRRERIWTRNDQRQKIGFVWGDFIPEPKLCQLFSKLSIYTWGNWTGCTVFDEYRKARYPVATPELVGAAKFTGEQLDQFLAEAECWFKNN